MKNRVKILILEFLVFVMVPFLEAKSNFYFHKDSIIILLQGEHWWGGIVNKGEQMPLGQATFTFDFFGDDNGNQTSPLLLSDKGRYIWSEAPFRFSFRNDSIIIDRTNGEIIIGFEGTTLRSAYLYASGKFFKPSGLMPDSLLFTGPQYNLWIELMYNPNQKDVLNYALQVEKNGFPAGVLMIDDNWTSYYGQFDFNKEKFPDAEALIDQLHNMGYKVMLWVCPFISPDSEPYRRLARQKLLLLDNEENKEAQFKDISKPLLVKWWNGYSACLDLTNPATVKWLTDRLDLLQQQYGVDGFKFDAGDAHFYNSPNMVSFKTNLPNEHSLLWAEIGLKYPLNEYRAMWKMGGQPIVERLRDKNHSWIDVRKLIPHMLSAGLLGYPFSCPDMIGGGEIGSFSGNRNKLDQELIVRSAQVHALMPMMQFSAAPWRVLDSLHLSVVKKAVDLRMKFVPIIIQLARESAQSGEPIVRHPEYVFPDQGFAEVKDQFMLGDNLMVAPVVEKGKTSRQVKLPKLLQGKWKADDGKIYRGGKIVQIEVPLDRLPYFEIVK